MVTSKRPRIPSDIHPVLVPCTKAWACTGPRFQDEAVNDNGFGGAGGIEPSPTIDNGRAASDLRRLYPPQESCSHRDGRTPVQEDIRPRCVVARNQRGTRGRPRVANSCATSS
jgi:hypothetical protein